MHKYIYPLFLLTAISLSSCKKEQSVSEILDKPYCVPAEVKEGLKIEKVVNRPIERSITLNGTIDYNKDKTVPYISLVDGVITHVNFSIGDYVKKGQILAEINSTDLSELQDDLKSSERDLLLAKRELESTMQMYEDGISSQKELIEAQSEVSVLEAKVKATRSNLNRYEANASTGSFLIKSPITGYIVSKDIANGSTVSAGEEALFTVADLSDVWVMINVYATSMRHIKKDLKVQVSTLAYPDEYFAGTISLVSQVFDSEERVLKAQVTMNNTEMKLKPGMAADVIIQLDDNQGNALAIPNNAIIFDNNQNYVVVYKDDCHQEIRSISPIAKNNIYTYVNANIDENDKVITTNELLIYEQLTNKL
ncbi:efflux RND transporter periplasmic adaptor subunit [Myroides sp. BIT-d1]|uniref:Efflux RND transporter periplasmic adaptor subunit n=1 Tax=Myroides albus TaxID=2562892 RepID=A0A6I3LN98_9FLAO|nr:efflux RND transporter periplasmic adaptor subunit [Myroides albus]MTG97465.1 efflux RND transporter periplasmic adaptor subunit [Myroides albus]